MINTKVPFAIKRGDFTKWQKSDVTKTKVFERVVGVAVMPLFLFLGFLVVVMSIGVAMALAVLRVLAKIFSFVGWKS